jgi:hypothetical protein
VSKEKSPQLMGGPLGRHAPARFEEDKYANPTGRYRDRAVPVSHDASGRSPRHVQLTALQV